MRSTMRLKYFPIFLEQKEKKIREVFEAFPFEEGSFKNKRRFKRVTAKKKSIFYVNLKKLQKKKKKRISKRSFFTNFLIHSVFKNFNCFVNVFIMLKLSMASSANANDKRVG